MFKKIYNIIKLYNLERRIKYLSKEIEKSRGHIKELQRINCTAKDIYTIIQFAEKDIISDFYLADDENEDRLLDLADLICEIVFYSKLKKDMKKSKKIRESIIEKYKEKSI